MKACEMCGASLEGCHTLRRFCDECNRKRKNARDRERQRKRQNPEVKVRHCEMCGAEVPKGRRFCDVCRKRRETDRRKKYISELRNSKEAPPMPIRPKDPLEGWSAVEIARLGRIWGLSYGYTVLKARETSPGALELLRKKVQREAL